MITKVHDCNNCYSKKVCSTVSISMEDFNQREGPSKEFEEFWKISKKLDKQSR